MLPERRTGTMTRLEAFSDAVFGFSATLLVVSLDVPDTIPALLDTLEGFAAFGLSFLALILIWSVHNAFFRRYELEDRTTIILNSCLLFVVLFYVYPLKFMTEAFTMWTLGLGSVSFEFNALFELSTMFMLYSFGFAAVFFCVALLYRHAWKSSDILELTFHEAYEAKTLYRQYMILVAVGLCSVLLAWLQLGLSFGLPGMIYFLLGPLSWWHGRWSKQQQLKIEKEVITE